MRRILVAGLAFAASVATCAAGSCERIVAIGDLHGGDASLELLLRRTDLVDEEGNWAGNGACLVQLGDLVDRGDRSRDVLDRLIELSRQAPSRVHVLLGNHEIMNIVGDLRYVSVGEFSAFADEETDEERERGLRQFLSTDLARETPEEERYELFDRIYPRGWFAHRRAFSLDGRYGRWLAERDLAIRLGRTLFVHGGIGLADARRGLDKLNRWTVRDLRSYFELREELERCGILEPLSELAQAVVATRAWLETQAGLPLPQQAIKEMFTARRFMRLMDRPILSGDGPSWDRSLAKADEAALANTVTKILAATETERIVVGHTTDPEARIRSRFDGRVYLIDTGAGPAYAGQPAALEIGPGGVVRAIYADRVEVLAHPTSGDRRIEEFLRTAEIVDVREIANGITMPQKVTLKLGTLTMSAAFKWIDEKGKGMTRLPSGETFDFSDRYVYERAAYLVDRRLGLDMVPVTVLRTVNGRPGSLTLWIESVIDEHARLLGAELPGGPIELQRQRAAMRLFDALIGNEDRNAGNQLYSTATGRLHLIDHSRGFRMGKTLPFVFTSEPANVSKRVLEGLEALDATNLRELLGDLTSRARIKALMARRDRIVKKIREDIDTYGEGLVVYSR